MSEDNLPNDSDGQPEIDASADPANQLPDDPQERLTALEARLAEAEKDRAKLVKEKQKAEEYAQEQKVSKDHWYSEVERLKKQSPAPQAVKPDAQPKDNFWLDADGNEKTLVDFASEGVSVRQLLNRAGVVTREEVERQMNEREEAFVKRSTQSNRLLAENPWLNDKDDPTGKEAARIFADLSQSDPDMPEAARLRIAVAEAKANVPVKARANTQEVNRQRLANGQGNGHSRSASKPTPTITDADRKLAQKMNGGVAMSDKDILEALKSVQSA